MCNIILFTGSTETWPFSILVLFFIRLGSLLKQPSFFMQL